MIHVKFFFMIMILVAHISDTKLIMNGNMQNIAKNMSYIPSKYISKF